MGAPKDDKPRFSIVPGCFFVATRCSIAARWLYCVMCRYANSAGMCWPSVVELVGASGIERRKVQRLLRELEDAGHVVTERSRGRGNVNRYCLPEKATLRPPFTEGKATPGPPIGREKAVALVIKGDTATARNIPEQTTRRERAAPTSPAREDQEPEQEPETGRVDTRGVLLLYCDLYKARISTMPPIGVKDRKLLKADLERLGETKLVACLKLAFGRKAPKEVSRFLARTGYTYGPLHSQLGSLEEALAGSAGSAGPKPWTCRHCGLVQQNTSATCMECYENRFPEREEQKRVHGTEDVDPGKDVLVEEAENVGF